MNLKIAFFLIPIIFRFSFANESSNEVFKYSSQYLLGEIDEQKMKDYLISKKLKGFSEDEKFLIIDTLRKKPIGNNELISVVESTATSIGINEKLMAEEITKSQFNSQSSINESKPWIWKLALTFALGALMIHSSGKKIVLDSQPFN